MSDLTDLGPEQFGFDLGDLGIEAPSTPDQDEVRTELTELLAVAKAAVEEAPWDERTLLYHKVVFAQMARWLPGDERDQLCFEFSREVQRIELLMAA